MSLLRLWHSLTESRHTVIPFFGSQNSTQSPYLKWRAFYIRFFCLDLSVSWLERIFGPGAVDLQSCLLLLLRLSTPLLRRLAGGRDCWLAMFLALVVTPELRDFLARARRGVLRLIKVCIQDGEWPKTMNSVWGSSKGWGWAGPEKQWLWNINYLWY